MSRSYAPRLACPRRPLVAPFVLVLAACLALVAPAGAAPSPDVPATRVPAGELVYAEGAAVGERFALPPGLRQALARTPRGAALHLEDFPVAPGFRARLDLERFDPYAPGATIWTIDEAGRRATPPSGRLFFTGRGRDDEALRVAFSYEPASGALTGLTRGPVGFYELQDTAAGGYEVVDPESLVPEGVELDYGGCASDVLEVPETVTAAMVDSAPIVAKATVPTLEVVVAVDTDAALLEKKFADSRTAATAWIEDLFVAMNVMYERDLSLRLLIGETTLRVGSDPYPTDTSGASGQALREFGDYWAANKSGVPRTFAMLLSGNSSHPWSSSGIAWVDGYCETQSLGGGYSVTQVFTADLPVSSDLRVVAHELGHNFGSPHTHCYTPTPIDTCWNGQSGQNCYQGTTTSCPAEGQGTLMSYCHVGACGKQNLAELHPRTIGLVDGFLADHAPSCIQPIGSATTGGGLIFADGFETGATNRWGS